MKQPRAPPVDGARPARVPTRPALRLTGVLRLVLLLGLHEPRLLPIAGVLVDAVHAVADRVEIVPVRLVVNHAPLVLLGEVPHAVVEERQRERPLPVPVWERLADLLLAAVYVR